MTKLAHLTLTGHNGYFCKKKQKTKTIKLSLHAFSLIQYCQNLQIPRGLRLQKGSTLFGNNNEFKQKWMAILNKCSLDLMLLVTDESMSENTRISNEIAEVKNKLKQASTSIEVFSKKKMEELQEGLLVFEQKTKDVKIKKLERNGRDYSQNKVYKWLNTTKNKNLKRSPGLIEVI